MHIMMFLTHCRLPKAVMTKKQEHRGGLMLCSDTPATLTSITNITKTLLLSCLLTRLHLHLWADAFF